MSDYDDFFVPDSDAERRYKEQVSTIIARGDVYAKTIIDMGKMPIIYNQIGIADSELKTNAFTIFKGLGLKGHNKHNVPEEVLENLLSLVHNPEAVCKSLSGSDNPNSYVSILNAKVDDKPIVAILSPSVVANGYTLIPSIYEKKNFERYLAQFAREGRALYVKEKGSELWGRLQSPPLHNSKPYTPNILTKEDVVKRIPQKNHENRQKAASYGAEAITKKEQAMADIAEDRLEALRKEANSTLSEIMSRKEEDIADPNALFTREEAAKLSSTVTKSILFEENGRTADVETLRHSFAGKEYTFYRNFGNDLMSLTEKDGPSTDFHLPDLYDSKRIIMDTISHFDQSPPKDIDYVADYIYRRSGELKDEAKENAPEQRAEPEPSQKTIGQMSDEEFSAYRLVQKQKLAETLGGPVEPAKEARSAPETGQKKPWKEMTAEEQAFTGMINQRAAVAHALNAGTLACLPGEGGYADTSPAVNLANGTYFHGAALLQLKAHQAEHGFPSAEYVTQEDLKETNVPVREGQKAVFVSFGTKDERSGKWENQKAWLYNAAQTAKPWELKEWAGRKAEERAANHEEFLKSVFGDSYKPAERPERKSGPEIICSSTEPEKYLGQYLAAVSMGGKFRASAEQAAGFKQKLGDTLWKKSVTLDNGKKHTNPFKLSKICNAAGEHCKEVIKEVRAEQNQEQRRQQTQSRGGRGR